MTVASSYVADSYEESYFPEKNFGSLWRWEYSDSYCKLQKVNDLVLLERFSIEYQNKTKLFTLANSKRNRQSNEAIDFAVNVCSERERGKKKVYASHRCFGFDFWLDEIVASFF